MTNFMMMTRSYKRRDRSHKEIMENNCENTTSNNWKKMNKSLKDCKDKTYSWRKPIKVSSPKNGNRNSKENTQKILEMKNLGNQTGTTGTSITNEIQEMEKGISGIEDTIEKK